MSTQVRQRITLVHGRVRSSESILRSFRLNPSRYEHAESADLSLSSPPSHYDKGVTVMMARKSYNLIYFLLRSFDSGYLIITAKGPEGGGGGGSVPLALKRNVVIIYVTSTNLLLRNVERRGSVRDGINEIPRSRAPHKPTYK
ncbi:hypothetical protein J6590_036091 [Homalodisca vitripennis]|nr:hypothetical protein J6590_036091 [Homalodisca vitripennis]